MNAAPSAGLVPAGFTGGAPFIDLGFETDLDGSVIFQPADDEPVTKGEPPANGLLLRTTDGGRSWHTVQY